MTTKTTVADLLARLEELNNTVVGPDDEQLSLLPLEILAGEYPHEAIEDYADNHHESLENVADWEDAFRESYIGEQSAAEYAEELAESCGDLENLPNWLRYRIDWKGVGRDMLLGGDVWESDRGFLFRG